MASALPLNERARNRCRAFTLHQSPAWVAFTIRACSRLTVPWVLAQSIWCHHSGQQRPQTSSLTFSLACLLQLIPLENKPIPLRGLRLSPSGCDVGSTGSLMTRDHAEFSALSSGVTFKPLSIPLQDSVRFFRAPLPAHPHSFSCDPPTHAILWVELRPYPVPSE